MIGVRCGVEGHAERKLASPKIRERKSDIESGHRKQPKAANPRPCLAVAMYA